MNENLNFGLLNSNTEEDEIYKQNILDHFKNPKNFGRLDNYTFKHSEFNPVCGDQLEISILIENNKVKEASFFGKGCAISMASASMLTEKIKNIPYERLKKLSESEVLNMIGVHLGVVRRKCGLLPLKVLLNGIYNFEVKNESSNN